MDAPGPGSYVLIAAADGCQPQASTVVVHDEPVTYDILLSGTSGTNGTNGTSGLTGTVRDAGTTLPVKDALIIVTDVRGDVLATGTTGEQGEFTFTGLVPDTVTVAVNAPGHRPRALPVDIAAIGTTLKGELDIQAVQGETLPQT